MTAVAGGGRRAIVRADHIPSVVRPERRRANRERRRLERLARLAARPARLPKEPTHLDAFDLACWQRSAHVLADRAGRPRPAPNAWVDLRPLGNGCWYRRDEHGFKYEWRCIDRGSCWVPVDDEGHPGYSVGLEDALRDG